MRNNTTITLIMLLMMVPLMASEFSKSKTEQLEKKLTFSGTDSSRSLTVDNIFGKVSISTYDGKEVLLKAVRTTEADNDRDLEKAGQEVKLDIQSENGEIRIIVDGPFRHKNGSCHRQHMDYLVRYDFDIRIPQSCDLKASTVNNGDIIVSGLNGQFKVTNVNGKISMTGINGYGKASTVNGSVRVDFTKAPKENCTFHTINGDVELSFTQQPSADFWCKTFNGSVYSDFDLTHLPSKPGKASQKGGMFVYKSNRFRGLRIGSGGTEIKMDSLNGDLVIANGSSKQ